MNKPMLFEKPSFEEALKQNPKTLAQAKEMLAVLRERLSGADSPAAEKTPASPAERTYEELTPEYREKRKKEHAQREKVLEMSRGSNLLEAEPGEKIFIANGKTVVIRDGLNIEVLPVEGTRAFKELQAALEAEKNPRERCRIAADMGELRRAYGRR